MRTEAWPNIREACPYCWPGHDPRNMRCPANRRENMFEVDERTSDGRYLIRSGAEYDLMLCECAPVNGWAPIHKECAAAMDAYMEDP